MPKQSCPGCESQLWALESAKVRLTASIYGVVLLPPVAVSTMMLTSDFLDVLTFPIGVAVAVAGIRVVPSGMRLIFRRVLARKRLPISSQPMRPPVVLEPSTGESEGESEYNKRRNRPPRKAGKTSVLGSFYKI
tara:strand:- start:112262 stop:112663 length:402 start_codon:yes stop_codon:yes gene_type:complete